MGIRLNIEVTGKAKDFIQKLKEFKNTDKPIKLKTPLKESVSKFVSEETAFWHRHIPIRYDRVAFAWVSILCLLVLAMVGWMIEITDKTVDIEIQQELSSTQKLMAETGDQYRLQLAENIQLATENKNLRLVLEKNNKEKLDLVETFNEKELEYITETSILKNKLAEAQKNATDSFALYVIASEERTLYHNQYLKVLIDLEGMTADRDRLFNLYEADKDAKD